MTHPTRLTSGGSRHFCLASGVWRLASRLLRRSRGQDDVTDTVPAQRQTPDARRQTPCPTSCHSARRDWFRSLGRWSAVAALGSVFAVLIGKRGWSAPLAACDRDRICSRCDQAQNCVQPEAMSLRAARRERRS